MFDFSGKIGEPESTDITGFVVFPDFNDARAGDNVVYFDNITFNAVGAPPPPPPGNALVDFETAGTGAGFAWTVFENADNPPLEVVANPVPGGINSSATVGKFTARLAGQPFAGVETAHGDIGPITLDNSNSIVKIMVYKDVISDVGIKFAIANGGAQPEIKVPNTLVGQWEELTFDFTAYIGLFEAIDIDQLIVFPDFQGRSTENIIYFDNITLSANN